MPNSFEILLNTLESITERGHIPTIKIFIIQLERQDKDRKIIRNSWQTRYLEKQRNFEGERNHSGLAWAGFVGKTETDLCQN